MLLHRPGAGALPSDRTQLLGALAPSLLALVLTWKYGFHLPLYRKCQIFAHAGMTLSRTTLMQWVAASSQLLGPLVAALAMHVLAAGNLNADDTPIKVLAPGAGKTKRGHLWTYVRDGTTWGSTDPPALVNAYRGSGSASYHPAMLLGLLLYGYSTKTFSSRAIERATHDSLAFRYIAGNEHPDHDTIATFRKRFLPQLGPLFVQVLKMAHALGLLKLGTVALDGTKVHANASRHSALSYGHAKKIEKQLKREVKQLFRLAERADAQAIRPRRAMNVKSDGMDPPAFLWVKMAG